MMSVVGGGLGLVAGAAIGMFMGHMIAGALLGMVGGIIAHRLYLKQQGG